MKKVLSFVAILIFYLWNFEIVSSEIFIKAKINNQILTNFDVKNEKNYLLALNPSLRNLSTEEINKFATDSLINENVKRIEIEKRYEILQNKKMINKVIKDIYTGLGISNINEFEQYLDKYSIGLDLVKKKISIEIAWNDYIFNKFNRSILIDEDKIKDKISKLSKQNKTENILLSEIIFTIKDSESLESKFNNIKNSIDKIGFEETAKIYSVSDSRKNGGKIGWVYKTQLSKKILNEIDKIDVGQLTKPITTPGGFILLKLNDKKDEILNIDKEEQFKKAINFEKNRQLTIYSTLQYKRVYNKSIINEF